MGGDVVGVGSLRKAHAQLASTENIISISEGVKKLRVPPVKSSMCKHERLVVLRIGFRVRDIVDETRVRTCTAGEHWRNRKFEDSFFKLGGVGLVAE